MKINIILPSKMNIAGGGVEKWIQYFLSNIHHLEDINDIEIFCFDSKENFEKIFENKFDRTIKFTLIPYANNKSGVYNMINFYINTVRKIKLSNGFTLFIGSINLFPLYFFIRNKRLTWIRSKAVGEQSLRKQKLFHPLLKIFEKITITRSDGLIFNGYDTKEYYKKYYRLNKNLYVIPNAVDLNSFKSQYNPSNKKGDLFNVCYTGRYIKAKGFNEFLEVAKDMSRFPEINFNTYGFGEINEPLQQFINDKGRYNDKQVLDIYKKNDVVLFLNKEEASGGISHSLLEAMASKILIIAWDNTVHNQILTNKNSFLVPEGNINELKNVLKIIADNPEIIDHKTSQAFKDVQEFSVEEHMKKFNMVLKEII